MSAEERKQGFDYEKHEAEAKGLEDAETSDASDEELIHDSSELPPFWKPEVVGETIQGVVCSVRKTQFEKPAVHFRTSTGMVAVHFRTSTGMVAVPVSVGLEDVNFEALIGRRLTITFKGLVETKAGRKVKQFRVTAEKLPF